MLVVAAAFGPPTGGVENQGLLITLLDMAEKRW